MCGIVGYIGTREAPEICLAGLRRLEYRGYDSAGIAVVNGKNLDQHKVVGTSSTTWPRLSRAMVSPAPSASATHGRPSLENSHPHFSADVRIAVVHNGILENYQELRAALKADTETMARAAASILGSNRLEAAHSRSSFCSKPASVWRSLFISGGVKQMREQMSKGTLWH